MDRYKPQPLEDRKSQKLDFGDYARERLLWAVLPVVSGGAALAFGRVTENKVWPLNGTPDLITSLHAKIAEHLTAKDDEIVKWIKDGAWAGDAINVLGGENKDAYRKDFFNFVKGAEVALPFSAYHLWHKKEEKRLDLQDAGGKLKELDEIKPSDAELKQQNDVMRKELAFAAGQATPPKAAIDERTLSHQGRVAEQGKGRNI